MSDIFDAKCPLKSPTSKEGKLQLASIMLERCSRIISLLSERNKSPKNLEIFPQIHNSLLFGFRKAKAHFVREYSKFRKLPDDEENIIDATVMFHPTNEMFSFNMIRNHIDWLMDQIESDMNNPLATGRFYFNANEVQTQFVYLDRAYNILLRKD